MDICAFLGFATKKIILKDVYLKRFSLDEKALLELLDGKTVAIVGNARRLGKQAYGADIEAHQIVVRLNDAPMVSYASHGSKTDWLAVAKKTPSKILLERQPSVLLWMPTKRKRLNWTMISFSGFFLNDVRRNHRLRQELNAPPSVGCMTIDLIKRSNASKISLYGFDFFQSKSLSGTRTREQVPHDFLAESCLVRSLLANDQRFRLYE